MSAQDYLQCGQIYKDVPVQSAWSHESIVQDICSISGGKNNDVVGRPHSCKRSKFYYSEIVFLWQQTEILHFTHHPSLPAAGWEFAPLRYLRNLTCWWSASSPQHQSHRCRQCMVLWHEPPWRDSWPWQPPSLTHTTHTIVFKLSSKPKIAKFLPMDTSGMIEF